jgi:hypothetical protein
MNAYASSNEGFGGFGRRFEDLMESVEAEIRQAVSYVDRVIVPEVRRETGGAARVLAVHLERFADRLDPLHARDANEKRGL